MGIKVLKVRGFFLRKVDIRWQRQYRREHDEKTLISDGDFCSSRCGGGRSHFADWQSAPEVLKRGRGQSIKRTMEWDLESFPGLILFWNHAAEAAGLRRRGYRAVYEIGLIWAQLVSELLTLCVALPIYTRRRRMLTCWTVPAEGEKLQPPEGTKVHIESAVKK